MERVLCISCLVLAAVGVAPPAVVPPAVLPATLPAGPVVAQTPGANAGMVAQTAPNAVANAQVAPSLRGQSLVAPTYADSKATADTLVQPLGSTPPTQARFADQAISQAAQDPMSSASEWASSLGALMFAAVTGAVTGGLWARKRSQEVQTKESMTEMRQQVATVAAAAALTMAPAAAPALIDYEGLKYLGGSDIVDLNNANIQAYRQFPGMFPTAAGQICTHGPYKEVADIYKIPGLDEKLISIMKKYEKQFIVLPVNEAYFIDRINNGMYR